MNLKVKSASNDEKELIEGKITEITLNGVKTDENGNIVEQTMPEVIEEVEKETGLSKTHDNTFTSMSVKELEQNLDKYIKAVQIIKDKMINGVHFLEIQGVEKPIITKQGTAWLASATGMTTEVVETKEIIKPEIDFILYQHKATASWGDGRSVSAYGSANSKEANQAKKYEDVKKSKTVYDTINDVIQMSQKRARVQAIKEMIAMTDIFETNEDNPKASKNKQQGVYRIFYQVFMKYAPKAPTKKKLKNSKWKMLTEKEQLTWQKEYLRSKYLQPYLLENGMPTHNWGIKDVEFLEKEIPLLPEKILELKEWEKDAIKAQKES